MTSASPRRRISVASPIACVLAAHAVRQFSAGPRAPVSSARCDSGMFGSCSSSRTTFIRSRAISAHFTESSCVAPGAHADSAAAVYASKSSEPSPLPR